MSFELSKKIDFAQRVFQFHPFDINEEAEFADLPILGRTFSDFKHVWHAKGPCIEVRDVQSGKKVGAWVFGGSIKDLQNKIICVEEIKADNGRLPMLLVALETPSGGQICILDAFSSRVLRAINMTENDQISSIHVIDSGNSLFTIREPSPLRYYDGIVAIGTKGGDVFLVDLCMQICEDALENPEFSLFRDELYPCEMRILPRRKIPNIKNYIETSMEKGIHIGIHLNAVIQPETEHFTLLGETGQIRLYVNKDEAEVSALYYAFPFTSLLVGYNFGAFQLWDLRQLSLLYTSPVRADHTPVSNFAVQEPDDDPKDYTYIWVSYSQNLLFGSGVPYAVMYALVFDEKLYLGAQGNLYEDFQGCHSCFELELVTANLSGFTSRIEGGSCIGLQSIKNYSSTGSLALCFLPLLMWDTSQNLQTCLILFDLDQWYKKQMPAGPDWSEPSPYIFKNVVDTHLLDVKLNTSSISQFVGVQKPEEHFFPTSLSFDVICLGHSNILKIHNKSLQNILIDKLKADGHLALCRPCDYSEEITSLKLTPIFFDSRGDVSNDTDVQRELLLSMILEQKLVHWLCNCASKLANDAFNSQGLSLTGLLAWAFERAKHLKSCCDYLCRGLFDHSGVPLDTNSITLVSNSTCQIKHIYSFYNYVSSKLLTFVCDKETLLEQQRCLEYVTLYYEVLLWMVNIGLLPEGQGVIETGDLGTTAYEAEALTKHYIEKRIEVRDLCRHQTFVQNDCLLFIDNMINSQTTAASSIRQLWQEDTGSGLYPPPSLQSAIRVYLLEGIDLNFKHSLMTYVLLDIAANLDENRQRNAIQRLLKFPQIFDLSQSRIKIVQAFWHLDHDDYQTALDYILDPSVLSEDLQHWHHSVMIKYLLLQEQFTLALQYLQVRKPSLEDEKDLLTVLSLMISKSLVNEAFKFYRTQERNDGQLFLMHIFKECARNEQLQSLLFRRLYTDEERSFFKYLQVAHSHSNEDLKIFYHLLRSRFLEAFDTYSNSNVRNPETQGLMGQSSATISDSIVKLCKNLMPDINRNLIEIVKKERSNIWKEVKRPTPLSMFAHNAREKICYKSDMIFATLSKAKRTFSDSFYENSFKEVNTENTPFLRTPSRPQIVLKTTTPVLNCTVIEQNETEEYGPSPRKKLKLSPRMPTTSPTKATSNLSLSRTLLTPIVKRKPSLDKLLLNSSTRLPLSILKRSKTFDESLIREKSSLESSRLKFPTSKSMSPSKVKFDIQYSTSSSDQSSPRLSDRSTRESENMSSEDIFYSPTTSSAETSHDKDINNKELCKTPENLEEIKMAERIKEMTDKIVTDHLKHKMVFQSPKSRQSYKRSIGDSPVIVRSSPRLSQKFSREGSPDDISEIEPCLTESQPPKPSPSVAIPKLRGRRSLARAVLEHNTFSKTRVSTYVEKSVLSISTDSNLSQFELPDSSVDSEGLSIDSPTLDASLLALMKECKDLDSKNSSLNKTSQKDSEVSNDAEGVTTVERTTTFFKKFEVRVDSNLDQEAGEIKDSCYSSSTPVTTGIENSSVGPTVGSTKEAETLETKVDTNVTANQDIEPSRIENSNNGRIEEKTKAAVADNKIDTETTAYLDLRHSGIQIRGYESTADQIKAAESHENKIDNDISSISMVDIADNSRNNFLPKSRLVKDNSYPEPENTATCYNDQHEAEEMDVDDEDALVSAVYDDLSSGSEDLREILQEKVANFEEEAFKDTSNFRSQVPLTEAKVVSQRDELSNSSNASDSKSEPLDKGFLAAVIEIESSDEDASGLKTHTLHQNNESRSSADTTDTSSRDGDVKSLDEFTAEGAVLPTYFSEQSNSSSRSGNDNSEVSSLDSQRTANTPDSIKDRLSDIQRDYDIEDSRQNPDEDSSSNDKTSTDGTNDRANSSSNTDIENAEVSSTSSSSDVPKKTKLEEFHEHLLKKDADIKIIVESETDYVAKPTELSESKIEIEKDFQELANVRIKKEAQDKEKIKHQLDDAAKMSESIILQEHEKNIASDIYQQHTGKIQEGLSRENEQMEFLQLVSSNSNTLAKEPDSSHLDMTSKALQCTLRFPEASIDKSNQDDLIKKTQNEEVSPYISSEPEEKLHLPSVDVTDLNESSVSTPVVLKTAVKKTYSKVEKKERELNKTPVLKPVKRTYLRRGRSGSQSSTFSGNETEDVETTKLGSLQQTLNTLQETVLEEISSTTQDQLTIVTKEEDEKKSYEGIGRKEKLDGKTASDTQESSVASPEETGMPRRITRRMSAHLDSSQPTDSPTLSESVQKRLQTDDILKQISMPGTPKRGRPPKTKSKSSSLVSSTEDLDEDQSPKLTRVISGAQLQTPKTYSRRTKSEKPSEEESNNKSPIKRLRLRSASVDQPQVIRTYSKKLRSKSIDEAANETSSEIERFKEKSLKVLLEPISEIPNSEVKILKETRGKAKSDIGTYTTARRLTRTQASILKSVVDTRKKLPSLEEMDPINLLDKPLFEGDPDPDESKVYEHNSSASSSPSVSASQRSRRRSISVASDVPSLKQPSVSSRASKNTGMKSRLRSGSADRHSDTSDSPSPSKKSKDKEDSKNSKPTTRNTRAKSVSSNKSNTSNVSNKTNTSVRSTRSKKTNVNRELQEIEEEKVDLDNPISSRPSQRPRKKN